MIPNTVFRPILYYLLHDRESSFLHPRSTHCFHSVLSFTLLDPTNIWIACGGRMATSSFDIRLASPRLASPFPHFFIARDRNSFIFDQFCAIQESKVLAFSSSLFAFYLFFSSFRLFCCEICFVLHCFGRFFLM